MKYTNNNSFYDYLSCPTCNTQKLGANPYLNGMNMTKMDSYQGTMDLPIYTLYGYDDNEDDDRDWEYMRFMYPKVGRRVQKEIDEECDKLEYEGSCMFDEYPDRTRLGIITNDIYRRLKDIDDRFDEIEAENIEISQNRNNIDDCRDGRCPHWPSRRPGNYGREDWLRDLIEVMLFNEMINRRRRHRNRRRRY